MNLFVRLSRGVAAAALALVSAAACGDDDVDIVDPPIQGGELFRSYVALGNSITAGYQSGGINDSTQRESYAYLFAQQLYGDAVAQRFRYPAFAAPGCTPPLTSLTGTRVGNTMVRCAGRTPGSQGLALNNVAVPGATTADLTQLVFTDTSNTLATLILGGRSQVQRALEVRPTFASVWIGNNDVLDAAVRGVLVPTPMFTAGATSVANFMTRYDAIIDSLQQAETLEGGALLGVVDVTNAPILFPAQALFNPTFKAGFDQYVGKTTTVLPNCVGSTSLLSFSIVTFFRGRPAAEPAVIGCAKNSVPNNTVVGDYFVLDAAEQLSIKNTVDAYNAYISAKADSIGFAYVNPNLLLVPLRTSGQIPAIPQLGTPARPYGTFVSIDGVHPARPAHVLVANALIDAVNAEYSVSIPKIAAP